MRMNGTSFTPVRALFAAALAWFGLWAVAPVRADEVRYTCADPIKGWDQPAFYECDWQNTDDLAIFTVRWHDAVESAVWLRLNQELTWQQVNNSYFRIAQDGTMQLSANGMFLASARKPTPQPQDYAGDQRIEVAGRNIYGLHLTAETGAHTARVEHIFGSWVPVKERVVRSDSVVRDLTLDSEVCLGPDGRYYLAATSSGPGFFGGPRAWIENEDIKLRRSTNLRTWENTLPCIEVTFDRILRPVAADCISPAEQ